MRASRILKSDHGCATNVTGEAAESTVEDEEVGRAHAQVTQMAGL